MTAQIKENIKHPHGPRYELGPSQRNQAMKKINIFYFRWIVL